MQRFVAISLCAVLFSTAIFAADSGYKVTYDGGSLPDTKTGTDMKLHFDASHIKLIKGKSEALSVRPERSRKSAMGRMSIAVSERL